MIYKDSDNKAPVLALLTKMLRLAGPAQQALLERSLRIMRDGIRSEREVTWLIDAHLKDSTRTAVLHDLRLDLGAGRIAQIDHLLIHRTRRFHLLETKQFTHGVKIGDDGQFLRWNDERKQYDVIASPLAQNQHDVLVLRQALSALGLAEAPVTALVLVGPDARIEHARGYNSASVVRAEQFMVTLAKSPDNGPLLSDRLRSSHADSIADIARKLIALHRPATSDYMARLGIPHRAPAALASAPAPLRPPPYTWVADSMRST